MRIAVIGAGPAGLYLAYLVKRRRPDWSVEVFEQNEAGSTFGFGVVFSDRALEFLKSDDRETHDAIAPAMVHWRDLTLDLDGERVSLDGIGFAAIGRLELLRLLQARAATVDVQPRYGVRLEGTAALPDFDIVVGADGVNSVVRQGREAAFGTVMEELTNRFIWFGTRQPFATLSQSFRHTPAGAMNAHHYSYNGQMSTFIVETDAATFAAEGLGEMDEAQVQARCEQVFADVLCGHRLVSNRSHWRRFPKIRNARFHDGRHVLLGDALHTAHFSIGSGTRLALEDAIALAGALDEHGADAAAGLDAYQIRRAPVLDKLTAAADASAQWYETFSTHMTLPAADFAMSYVCRSGRISDDRLEAMSPGFMTLWRRHRRG